MTRKLCGGMHNIVHNILEVFTLKKVLCSPYRGTGGVDLKEVLCSPYRGTEGVHLKEVLEVFTLKRYWRCTVFTL